MVWALQNLLDTAAAAPSPSSDSISLQSPPSLLPPHFLEIPPQSSDSPGLRRLPGETDPFETLVPGQPAPPGCVLACSSLAIFLRVCVLISSTQRPEDESSRLPYGHRLLLSTPLPHKVLFGEDSPQQDTQNQQPLHPAPGWEGQLRLRKCPGAF